MGPPWGAFCQITLTSCFLTDWLMSGLATPKYDDSHVALLQILVFAVRLIFSSHCWCCQSNATCCKLWIKLCVRLCLHHVVVATYNNSLVDCRCRLRFELDQVLQRWTFACWSEIFAVRCFASVAYAVMRCLSVCPSRLYILSKRELTYLQKILTVG